VDRADPLWKANGASRILLEIHTADRLWGAEESRWWAIVNRRERSRDVTAHGPFGFCAWARVAAEMPSRFAYDAAQLARARPRETTEIVVAASGPRTFARIARWAAGRPGYAGLVALGHPVADQAALWVGARLWAMGPVRPLAFVATLALGPMRVDPSRRGVPSDLLAEVVGRVEALELGIGAPTVAEWGWAAPPCRRVALPPAEQAIPPLDEVLGPDPCTHAEARWEPNAGSDALVLACPACRRRRVALIPAHRLPHGHPLLAAARWDEARYLARERAWAELAGDRGRAAWMADHTLDELRDADGVAGLGAQDVTATAGPPVP
jgi:hypothetical protein